MIRSGIHVEVHGVDKLLAALKSFRLRARDLKDAFADIGAKVKTDAKPLVNTRTGRLEGDIRAGKAKSRAVVRVGRASVPYAGVNHYGNYTPPNAHSEIVGNPFLVDAAQANEGYSVRRVDQEITKLIRAVGLN